MFLYNFFDYKYNIENFSSDLFSTPHIVYIILAIIFTFAITILLRNTKKDNIKLYLRILSISVLTLEIVKISWESYYDITTGRGFNSIGLLPIYTCSIFIYTSLLAAWTKGKVEDVSLSYLSTISLLAGLIGVIYCNGLNYYPFWTFGAFYSLFFHFFMFFTGVLLLMTRYKELKWIDSLKTWIPVLIISIIAIPINYKLGADYMQIYSGDGVPLMNDLASILASHHLRGIFTVIMILVYIPMACIPILISKVVYIIINKVKQKNCTSN